MCLSDISVSLSLYLSNISRGGKVCCDTACRVNPRGLSHDVCAPSFDCILFSVLSVSCCIPSVRPVMFVKSTAVHSHAWGLHRGVLFYLL